MPGREPGCCQAEYLDQPVAPFTVDQPLHDGQALRLGDADWQVVRTPGHTPGHLSLWQPDERLLVVGDALSDYDVGWVNLALDGPDAAATALASLHRLADLALRVLLPSHGPILADPGAAFATALRRAQRLVDDPAGAVWYGVRRIFAFALIIRDGIPVDEVDPYLHARAWLTDAARLLDRTPETLAAELVDTMLRSGAIVRHDGRLHAAAEHAPVATERCGCRSPAPGRRRRRQDQKLPNRSDEDQHVGLARRTTPESGEADPTHGSDSATFPRGATTVPASGTPAGRSCAHSSTSAPMIASCQMRIGHWHSSRCSDSLYGPS